ncbi:uncharacterized protein TNCT_43841 [Trichonephila clavata]|uniref:Uncharacterized protein n=1 Tax=Trichonephila clavata TaxID=2740835 RepID=A0A8X6EWH8_TRICU|nr:uncharacterized protein TNCT_43841 [Trichonephila clavata]
MDDSDIWASQIINELFENYQEAKHQANQEVSDVLLQDSVSSEVINYKIVNDKENGELHLKDFKSAENIHTSSTHSILVQEPEVIDVTKKANESLAIEETFKVSEHDENLVLPNAPSWLSDTYIHRLPVCETSSPNVKPIISISAEDSNDNISFGESRYHDEASIISYNAEAEKTECITENNNAVESDNNSLADEFILQKSKEIDVNNDLNTCVQREQSFNRNEHAENFLTPEAPICKTLSPITMPVMNISIHDPDDDAKYNKSKEENKTASNFFDSMEEKSYRIEENSLTDKSMIQTSKDVNIKKYSSQCAPTGNTSKKIGHTKDLLSSEIPICETTSPFISPMISSFSQDPNENIKHEESIYGDETTVNSLNQIFIKDFDQSKENTFEDNVLCSNLLESVVCDEQLNKKTVRYHTDPLNYNKLDSNDPSTFLQFTTNDDLTIKSVLQLETKTQETSKSHLNTDFVAALTLALTNGIENVAANDRMKKVAEKTIILREANTLPKKEIQNPYRYSNLTTGMIITSPRDRNIIVQSYRMLVTFIEICLIIPITTYLEKYLDLFEFILALIVCMIYDSLCTIKSNAQNAFLSDSHLIVKEDNTDTAIKITKYNENDNVEKDNDIETYNVPSFKSKTSKSSMSLIAFSSDTSSMADETNELISLADDKSTKSCCEGSIGKIVGDVGISTFEMNIPNNMLYVNQLSHPLIAMFNESTTTEWNEESVNKKETFERSFSISPMKGTSKNINFLSKGVEAGTLKPSPMLKEYFKKIEELGTSSNMLGNAKISIEKGRYFTNFDSLLELECIKKVESEADSNNFHSNVGEFDKTQNNDIDFKPKNRERSLKNLNGHTQLSVNILKQEALILKTTEKNNENILDFKKPHVKEKFSLETKEDGESRTLVESIFPNLQPIDTTEDTEEDKYLFNGEPFKNLETAHNENEETDNSKVVSEFKTDENNHCSNSFGVGNDDMTFESFGKESTTEDVKRHGFCSEENKLDFDQNVDKPHLSENITENVTIIKKELEYFKKVESETDYNNFLSNVAECDKSLNNDIDFKTKHRETSLKNLNDELKKSKSPHEKEEIRSETKGDRENRILVENIFSTLQSNTTEDTEDAKYLFNGDFIPFKNLEIAHNENEKTDNSKGVSEFKTDEINHCKNSFGVVNDDMIFESFGKESTTENVKRNRLCSEEKELDFDQSIDKPDLSENITENVTIVKKELQCIKKVESETDSNNFLSNVGECVTPQNNDIDFKPEHSETSLMNLNDELNVNILKQEVQILNKTEKNNENMLLEIEKSHEKEETSSEYRENRTLVENIFSSLPSNTTEDTEDNKYLFNGGFIPFRERNLEMAHNENEETDNSEAVYEFKTDEISHRSNSFGVVNENMIFESFGKELTTEDVKRNGLCSEEKELDFDQNIDKPNLCENITENVTIVKKELECIKKVDSETDSYNFLSNVAECVKSQNNDIDFKPEHRETSLKNLNDELNVNILKQEVQILNKKEKNNENMLLENEKEEASSDTKEYGENRTLVKNISPTLQSIDTTEGTEEDKYLFNGVFIPLRNLEVAHNENEETYNSEVVSEFKTDEINHYSNSFGVGNNNMISESLGNESTTEVSELRELCSEENELDFDHNIGKSDLRENITENVTIDKKDDSFGENFDPFLSINKSTETDSVTENHSVLEDFASFAKIQNVNVDDKARNKNNTVSLTSPTVQTSVCIADENQDESNKLRNLDTTSIPNNRNETELNISISNGFNNGSCNKTCLVPIKSYSIEDLVQKENDGRVTKYMSEVGFPFLQSINSCIGSDIPEKNCMFRAEFSPSRELENTFTSFEYKSNNKGLPEAIKSEQIDIREKLDYENKDDAFVNLGNMLTVKITNQDELDSKPIILEMDESMSNFTNNVVSKIYFSEEFIPRVNYTEFEEQNEIKEIQAPKERQENINSTSNEFLIDIGCKRDVLLDHDCLELNKIKNLDEKNIATFLEQDQERTTNGSKNKYTGNDLFDNVTYDQHDSYDNVEKNDVKQIESEFFTQINDCSETRGGKENETNISFKDCFTEITHLDTKKETTNVNENCSRNIILDESITTCCGYGQEESLEISQEMGDGRCSTINISLEVNCSLESIGCLSSDEDDDEDNDFLESVERNSGTRVYQSISGYISLENSVDTEMESFYCQEQTKNAALLDKEPLLESEKAALISATVVECSNEEEIYSTCLSVPQFKSSENKHSQSSSNIPNVPSSQVLDSVKMEVPQSSEPFELDRPSENNVFETTVEQQEESKSTSDIKKKKQGNIKHRVSSVWRLFQRADKGHKYKKYHDDT